MSDIATSLRCFNSITGKRDGGYCVWEGGGKCMKCTAADEIERLRADNEKLRGDFKNINTWRDRYPLDSFQDIYDGTQAIAQEALKK